MGPHYGHSSKVDDATTLLPMHTVMVDVSIEEKRELNRKDLSCHQEGILVTLEHDNMQQVRKTEKLIMYCIFYPNP